MSKRQDDYLESPDRRRVAIFVPRLAIGGTEQHLLDVLPSIDPRRFIVTVITTRGPGPLDSEMRRCGVRVFHARYDVRRPLSLAAAFLRIVRFLRRERPDIIHFFLPEAYLIGGLCAVTLGQRRRVMSRRSLNIYQRRRRFSAMIERWLHRRMDAVLANSNAVAKELIKEGVSEDQLHTVYSGIDMKLYAGLGRFAARRELMLDEGAVVFVCVANLISYKGHRDLLEAFAIAASRLPEDWQLLIVGRDEGIGTDLRELADKRGLGPHIRWLGERTDVPIILKASDVAVLASHEEGLPKSILEAMAAGLPSIVTDVGGSPEAILDNVTGKVVKARDITALAEALVELANDEPMRSRFGQAAKSRVDELFRLDTCVAEYEKIYDSLFEQPAPVLQSDTPGSARMAKPDRLA